ncbi:hypothetical protein LX32DRAFT_178550 [Colletotrichum zoysiae]|uniref:Uncharacterized protein n=1 Tax=Colletotrichum zoysiae TaxID=1216348 RepID=A0AAD9LW39_9PEZI|nr:hypothetical protein LX32DRAFT_178550 [Colletotrichum zoysiae]
MRELEKPGALGCQIDGIVLDRSPPNNPCRRDVKSTAQLPFRMSLPLQARNPLLAVPCLPCHTLHPSPRRYKSRVQVTEMGTHGGKNRPFQPRSAGCGWRWRRLRRCRQNLHFALDDRCDLPR